MAENKFNSTVDALINGVDNVVSSKTVVGDAIHVGDTIILPLVDVSFAVGAGTFKGSGKESAKETGAGGLGGKITPSAVLVIQNGRTRLINIKSQDTMTKLLDLIPDVLDRVSDRIDGLMTEKDVNDMLDDAEL